VSANKHLEEFMGTYVKEIIMFYHSGEMVSRNDFLPLYSEVETSIYEPEKILEVIYESKSIWERIKSRAKKIVKEIPSTLFSVVSKLFGLVLGYFGFGGGLTSVMWKVLPTKSVI
jgi:hypothetical protein